MSKKAKRIIISIIGVLGVLVGVGLMFNQPIQDHAIKQNQTETLHKIKHLTPKKIQKNNKRPATFNYAAVKPMNAQRALQAHRQQQNIIGIGMIAIPDVNLHLPIVKGLSDANLATGGATMRPDQVMGKGNYPLAGHYMTNQGILFSPIENTQLGQKVYLTDMKHVYTYQIYSKKIVSPTSVYLVDNTKKPIVTLITCADGGKNRWAVRGTLINKQKYNSQSMAVF